MTASSSSSGALPLRRVLVCVSGMSPAIVTETLYALVKEHDFVPDEVHVITTLAGQKEVSRLLLDAETGHFHAFLRDHLPGRSIRFDDSTIHLIGQDEHGQGTALKDIQNDDDNWQAANTIYRVLRTLKAVPGTQLHASVAGGRKSMSFYMGQAFSLVAEPDDRLSHVLVNAPDELMRDFFYPRPKQRDNVEVILGDLSVLKLGPMLREMPLKAHTSLDFAIKIAQYTVIPPTKVQLVWSVQEEAGQVRVFDGSDLLESISLTPQHFKLLAFYAIAQQERLSHAKDGEPGAFNMDNLLGREPDDAWRIKLETLLGSGMFDPDSSKRTRNFNSAKSKLMSALTEKLGTAANWFLLESTGKSGRYQLRLSSEKLELIGLHDWKPMLRNLKKVPD